MACRTPSVDRVANNMNATLKGKLAELEKTLQDKDDNIKAEFFKRIDSGLKDAMITDARQIEYNSAIKTEMTSEFNLDAISGVITAALDTAIAVLGSPVSKDAVDAGVKSPLLTPAALESYKGLVTSVVAAARSSSKGSTSLSFSMNRLSVGVYAFLYASSINLEDKETFGTETITVTTIYYRIIQSIQDVKMQGAFDAVLIAKDAYIKMVSTQAALIDKLANDEISIDAWIALDAKFTGAVATLKARLDAFTFGAGKGLMAARSFNANSDADRQLVQKSIKKLETMGDSYKVAISVSRERLENAHF
jgi:hypothetical protein